MTTTRIFLLASIFALTGCGYPFGEPYKCNKFVKGCFIG